MTGHVTVECQNCLYWQFSSGLASEINPSSKIGYCRRHAPQHLARESKGVQIAGHKKGERPFLAIWPETFAEEWCGEFEANPPSP